MEKTKEVHYLQHDYYDRYFVDPWLLVGMLFCGQGLDIQKFENELTADGRDGKLRSWDKRMTIVVVPVLMIVVLLNVFRVIK